MPHSVFLIVLGAAFLHAAWNALVKQGSDRLLAISMMAAAQGVIAIAVLPFTAFPNGSTWAWILLSAALHTGYKLFLIRAYQVGDLSQVYPLARGSAPLLTAIAGYFLLDEALSPLVAVGVVTLCLGIALMSLKGGDPLAALDRRAVLYAFGTSVFIAGYSLADGVGARGAASPTSYLAWMFLFDSAAMATIFIARRGRRGLASLGGGWRVGAPAAVLSLAAYWLIVWAMTQAPIAAVSALRESSVLFALAISTFILKERMVIWRLVAAMLILAGVAAMRAG